MKKSGIAAAIPAPIHPANEEQIRVIVRTTLNQCFCDYGKKRFSKYFLLEMSDDRVEAVGRALAEWEVKGYVRVFKPLDAATDKEDCVKMLKPIEWE